MYTLPLMFISIALAWILTSTLIKKFRSLELTLQLRPFPRWQIVKHVFILILGLTFVLPWWAVNISTFIDAGKAVTGWREDPILLSGTGSMFPTFPKGTAPTREAQAKEVVASPGMIPYPNGVYLFGSRLFSYTLKHGDIVSFENDKTREITAKTHGEATGLVKRIIGLPGDTIEIRDGQVILNNQVLEEPYIARARSTFGGETVTDCKVITISDKQVFVMGDNRKGSGDSRHEIGLINYNDIDHVLPLEKQIGKYDLLWRDTSNDQLPSAKISLNKNALLEAINKERASLNLKPLKFNEKLNQSSELRGQTMLNFNDLSFEATRSGYTMERAMQEVGYSNIVYGEMPILGYYEAEELIEHLFEFPESKEFFLGRDYQDIGISQVEGDLNGCPAQVIVQHLGGYIPPNYKSEDIQNWEKSLNNLREIEPGWKDLKNFPAFYSDHKADIDRLTELIDIRIRNISGIVEKMKTNLWLTKEQIDYTYRDQEFSKEQNAIADRLNNAI